MGQEAWVTSAVEDDAVDKALVLAGSLRRVWTTKKLAVFTYSTVSKKRREALKDAFDLVLLLDDDIPKGWSLEDYAKVQAFSLVIFDKCVYLSPNAMVLKNCDEIFGKYTTFAAVCNGPKNTVSTSVYFFRPNLEYGRKLSGIASGGNGSGGVNGSGYFSAWIQNNIANIEKLDEQYNLTMNLNGKSCQGLNSNVSIITFSNGHPLQCPRNILDKTSGNMGHLEKLAVDTFWSIYMEDIKTSPRIPVTPQYKTEPIAIVGMSFRLPGGNNVDEFWSLLAEGRNAVVPLPSHRWTKDRCYAPCQNRNIQAGFLNVPIDEFDSKFFGLSPKEAEFLDPQQRLLMEVTWEALEDAMIDPMKLSGTQTGVFVGSWIHDYKDMLSRSPDCDFFRTYMGNSIATSAARLSHFFETNGPSIATESGCSSAIAAVDMACKSLRNGDSSFAIAAGANLLLHPFEPTLMEYVLSPDCRCKTFDENANGFARAEGCAALLLKRYSDAIRDEDNIWGLIRGTALTQEGTSKSLGTPTVHGESLAMELALKDAGVDPKDVSYVEAHGTGTPVGDPMEILAIERAYSKGRSQPLYIGSVKTNVGHTESVSGITGIIKVLLSMKNEVIPRHLNLGTLNPNIKLDGIPAQIPLSPVPWPRKDNKRRIAGVSSFGISGTDGHVIIEEPPKIQRNELTFQLERPLHILKLSAKSVEAMEELIQKYLDLFNERRKSGDDSTTDFANLAYSANIGRTTFNHRVIIKARNCKEAVKALTEKSYRQADVQSHEDKLCFLFTGQGSQYPNMAKQLYETSPVFKDNFDRCDDILNRQYRLSVKNVLWNDEGKPEELDRSLHSQTSIFVVEYCLLKLWEYWGIKPDYVMGHSLGEFAAAVAAGALDFEDALMLVAERSKLTDQLPKGKMLVIKAEKKRVDEMVLAFQKVQPTFWVDYAALNSPEQTVVAGESEMLEKFSKFCQEKSLKTIVLAATHAFHSRHMDPMLETYRKIAVQVKKPNKLSDPLPKYISGVDGKLVDIALIGADYWVRHTREKVRYMDACKAIQQEGCSLFLEVGPHPVLSALTMMNLEGQKVTCLPSIRRKEDEWATMLDTLSKLYLSNWKGEIDWKGFDRYYSRKKINLPFYPFNRKPIWARVESIHGKIHSLIGTLMPTASNDTIFKNSLTLKNNTYLQDHIIGNTVVFPGAGFLEMCLVGGHATVQGLSDDLIKPKRPVILQSLKITSPLALCESEICKLQTVITLNDQQDDANLGYSVGVHTNNGNGKWVEHATAKFLPMAPSSLPPKPPLDMSEMKSDIFKDFYEKLPEVGLRFGPQFQSLQNGWRSEEALMASVKVPQDYKNFLIHPVIADAMIQAMMLWTSKGNMKKKLQVPVQIGEFIWLREASSSNQFVYCSSDGCCLLEEDGTILAYMRNVDFIETTAKLVQGMIAQQSVLMPQLWEEVWRSNRGPRQGYITHSNIPMEGLVYSDDDLRHCEEENTLHGEELEFYLKLIKLTRTSILNALHGLGWKPEKFDKFTVESLVEKLNIKREFQQYIRFFFRSMTREDCGFMKALDEGENIFRFEVTPPPLDILQFRVKDPSRVEYRLIMELAPALGDIFLGKIDTLSLLFPGDPGKPSAGKFYESGMGHMSKRPLDSKISSHVKSCLGTTSSPCRPIYRVLEVGAGTAVLTKHILNQIISNADDKLDIEYHVTDVSASFFTSAEKTLEDLRHLKNVNIIFKKFDMENDPLEEGLCPGYFDMVTATEVFHIAKDVKKTMQSVRSLLKPGGMIIFIDTVSPDERITFIFGLLEGYWQFEDREFRRNHITLTPNMWKETLEQTGFHGINAISLYNNVHGIISGYALPKENMFLRGLRPVTSSWIIFANHENDNVTEELSRMIKNVNRKCLVIPLSDCDCEKVLEKYLVMVLESAGEIIEGIIYLSPETRDQRKISLPFLTLMKLVSEIKSRPKTFVVMKGTCVIGESNSGVINPAAGTLLGFCKALSNENLNVKTICLDLDPQKETMDQLEELFMNLWVDGIQGAAFRNGLRLCPKLAAGKISRNEPLSLPGGCDRFQLVLPKTRLISDLEFAYLEPYSMDEDEVEVEVKAMALNFRDIFAVLKPIPAFENINSVGLDFAGVVVRTGAQVRGVKVGDHVCGFVLDKNLSLPSHYKSREDHLFHMPEHTTFAEGVTLPAVFYTAHYCLIDVAKMKKGETVLLHTASGGVGLVAIQLCKHFGVHVIATAGSRKKQTYLRNLGIQHVFHSRTLDFKREILEVTGGRGVDIVLNSLTGPGFKEASLDVLTKNGRFIEMSKLNVWAKEEVKALRPDVFYEVVDLTNLEAGEMEKLAEHLREWMNAGQVKPLPYERFDALNIRGALNYLQKAKHIGKIVCIMPEVKLENSKLITKTPLFNQVSTYVVTGGLGGIGLEIVKWMLGNGAVHIAILSRSHPKPEIAEQIKNWNKAGKHVQAFPVNVGDYGKLKTFFEDLQGFPPIRGIMHAAGVLNDAVLENQSWDKFAQTYNPKVDGSWNLHDLTKDYLLEHFVLFSSMAATLGSPGQTNHSASNAFEDSLAAYRRSNGLPATCINWGNWGEVGVATEVDFPGLRPISTLQGLLALETFLKTQTSHMNVLNVDSFGLLSKAFPLLKTYIDDTRLLGDAKQTVIINSDEFWNQVESAQDQQGKVEAFKRLIKTVLRSILKMEGDELINDQAEFQTLGIDSLMLLEMKNGVQNILGGRITLTASQLKDCNNTEVLANTLVDMLEGRSDSKKSQLSHEELKLLIREDSALLSEDISVEGLDKKEIGNIETVLLTGATGNLGPYLLKELTERSQITTVYCLVRPTTKLSGMERIKEKLQEFHLTVNTSKVKVIEGDITTPNFGLSEDIYLELCKNVDAIVHSAVRSDHTAKYWKAPESNKSHMRTVNVLGTLRLLEFAAVGRLKHFFHASTMTAFTGTGKDGQFSEGWQDVSAFDNMQMGALGYVITKHICEQLVYNAIRKGIPCKAFRFPPISGDSKTGRVAYQQNHFILRWLTCMKLGVIHDIPAPLTVVPVDHCAKLSLDIFFNAEAPMDVYNIIQKTLEVEQIMVEVAQEFGIKMEIVSHEQFMERLKGEDENSPIANFVKMYVEEEEEFTAMFENPSTLALKKYFEDGSSFLGTSKLAKFAPNYEELVESTSEALKRDFRYLRNEGVFKIYGIKTSL